MSPIQDLTRASSTVSPSDSQAAPDFGAIKARQQATWSSGDYGVIGRTLQWIGESLCEAVDLRSGDRVLDVACGNGNASLAAARRFCRVVGVDYVPELFEQARTRAEAECVAIDFRLGDAEALEFADASFDCVLSTLGVMFAPDQERAARELARVCKPGGTIGLANWTPEGFCGQMLKTVGRYAPPPAGLRPPTLWGTRARIEELFAGSAARIVAEPRLFCMRYESAEHWLAIFREWYGPMHAAYGRLDTAGQAALTADMLELLRRFDRGGGHGLVVPAEYLEVVITR